ncbi:CPBP family intramembrane metalloprotease [Amycolatopsis thermalba]|uniref:CPBP family intramembrane metalloprotease n=1 Tax=Amycolatopsis thermalba TaxID=944492 RepID=A0ABY4P216_9PSEU|nr:MULTISPECIES: type II CAAX endopeptidase family protein [Amycolatopsis]UQS26410.1 CPBP family intramembrane metalloprotease [Amycolatopsis thermalba]
MPGRATGSVVLAGGLLLIAGSALWFVLTGDTGVRYSSDTGDTVPMWFRWIPVLAGVVLVRLVPFRGAAITPAERRPRLEAGVLLASAVLFAVTLGLAGGGEPAHTLLKVLLLLGVPAAMFWILRRWGTAWRPAGGRPEVGRRWAPAIPVAAWVLLSYASPWATPSSDFATTVDLVTLVLVLVVGFLVNSLLEEVFYRRWLQSRWEALIGRWPAIVLASLLWAVWHVAIHGSGDLPADLASAFVNQGVLGLFLGFLWSEYRMMWPLLVVHGAVNAVPVLLPLV